MVLQKKNKSVDQITVEENLRLHKFVVARIAIKKICKNGTIWWQKFVAYAILMYTCGEEHLDCRKI